ncbi:hypothetical protein AMECASPLE_039348 [Ameca splendens]|uniref:Uncharacterized protein n=1 Tax=Ameca splendens TaxID=208324 RepID=A0ABV0XXW2_9TELE
MTPLDPIEEFMSVCQQRDISALSLPIPMITGVEDIGPLEEGAFMQPVASWEVCCYSLLGCARSRLMQFILKGPEKFVPEFNVEIHGCGSQQENPEHPLHETVLQQQSVFSQRLLQICCKTESYRRYFLPTAISIYNGSLKKPS